VDTHSDLIHRFEDSLITIFPQEWQWYSFIVFGVERDLSNAFRCLVGGFDCVEDCNIGFLGVSPHHSEYFIPEFFDWGFHGRTSRET